MTIAYMRKFASAYRVRRDACGMDFIEGRFGKRASKLAPEERLAKIGPYDPENGVLGVWATGLPAQMAAKRLTKLKPVLTYYDECEDGFIGHFRESKLAQVCAVIGARKRRKASPAQMESLQKANRVLAMREAA